MQPALDPSLAGPQLPQPWNARGSARWGLSPRGGALETLTACHPTETLAACLYTSCSQAPATWPHYVTGMRSPPQPRGAGSPSSRGWWWWGRGSSHLPPLGSRELISEFFVKHFEAHKAGSSERRHCKGFVYRRCRGRGEPDACSPALPAPSPSRLLSCLTSVPLAPGSLGQETPEGTGS